MKKLLTLTLTLLLFSLSGMAQRKASKRYQFKHRQECYPSKSNLLKVLTRGDCQEIEHGIFDIWIKPSLTKGTEQRYILDIDGHFYESRSNSGGRYSGDNFSFVIYNDKAELNIEGVTVTFD